ncbi:multifunctional aminopeptidase A [Gemmata obscuriglobus]|uniref:Peptidase M17 n=1 Tax=Gemmata obscuriglobus TaxID=114 RepID=A0A2Z3H8R5_9BACT|nr:M17 family peptidase N-terminal domain-containing protein [Gemmata obscuriglobus]AWM37450.1 peptidase M17 [Gemmata obscuriglobus]QEG29787.1 multifunctional aminopeptidase A [Gemmata obscuriglobus]VTS09104.1 peptidase m17 : Leucyl aminopeptidase OS=Singulisphaera acidiphila (strain ATCC BAA-1392 / DSM 18658 / VKM B-2454 / MOB10) GN=Sinac_4440 PE=4 SV=1: Peptidase_M17_N [Gemmata obscuriglobus UQM 2246]
MFRVAFVAFAALFAPFALPARGDDANAVKETVVAGPGAVALKVRMEGPYTADVPLQVVCYFKYTAAGAKKMTGAPVELDKHLGGVIAALRERGEFAGDELETVLITPPEGAIKAKALLLVGLGEEGKLSLQLMERVGRVAAREAVRLGARKVAFAPLLRDQGNDTLKTGDVEAAVVRGALTAYDTERRLQKEGLGKGATIEEWWVEAGPAYYDETVAGVKQAAAGASELIKARNAAPYTSKGK